MSELQLTNMESTMNSDIPQLPAAAPVEEKVYVTPDPSKGKRFTSFDDFLNDICTPEEVARVNAIAATQSVGHALTGMRIAAGISQKMMAAALGVTQPRVSMIESAPNSKASWQVIRKYVEVTKHPFKAVLEDGSVMTFTSPALMRRRPVRRSARRKTEAVCA